MPISFRCLGCQKVLNAPEGMGSKRAACPHCKQPQVVPADGGASGLPLPPPAPRAAVAAAPAPAPPPTMPAMTPPWQMPVQPTEQPVGLTPAAALPAAPTPPRRVRAGSAAAFPAGAPRQGKRPALWLTHLHWLLVLALTPLAVSLLMPDGEEDFANRLEATLAAATEEEQAVVVSVLGKLEKGQGSVDDLFDALPGHKLHGALLARDSCAHWGLAVAAAALFLPFVCLLATGQAAQPKHLLIVGVATATFGVLFLLCVQWIADWTQGFIVHGRGLLTLVFWLFKLIGYSYRAALDPDSGLAASFAGFTLGVGLCEELAKALPILFGYRDQKDANWRGAFLWGLASGAGFGIAEGIMYSSNYYNGITGPGIYLVRFLSCVALHAVWTASAGISIFLRREWFDEDGQEWYDLLLKILWLLLVPMVLHGLYDTLLKKEMNGLALVAAVASFAYLAIQISRMRRRLADVPAGVGRRARAMG